MQRFFFGILALSLVSTPSIAGAYYVYPQYMCLHANYRGHCDVLINTNGHVGRFQNKYDELNPYPNSYLRNPERGRPPGWKLYNNVNRNRTTDYWVPEYVNYTRGETPLYPDPRHQRVWDKGSQWY